MKFSFSQVRHTLYWNFVNFLSDLRLIPFMIKLKTLSWWYGGGDKIPPDKLGTLSVSKEEEQALLHAVAMYNQSVEIADKFHLPPERRSITILVAKYYHGNIDDVELNDAIGKVLDKPNVRLAMYKAMRACGDITDDDLGAFQKENDWKAFVEWLDSPTNPKV